MKRPHTEARSSRKAQREAHVREHYANSVAAGTITFPGHCASLSTSQFYAILPHEH